MGASWIGDALISALSAGDAGASSFSAFFLEAEEGFLI
jgi:hypothetical protein